MDSPSKDHVKKLVDSRRELLDDHSSRRGKKTPSDDDKAEIPPVEIDSPTENPPTTG
jgi:hypothetical protein